MQLQELKSNLNRQHFQCTLFQLTYHRNFMSSESDYHSSSSPNRSPRKKQEDRSRSRSRDRRVKNQMRDKKIKLKAPELNGPLLSLKNFTNIQTEKISSQTIHKAYEKYKREWEEKQNQSFLSQYRDDAWFNEKYNPQILDELERGRRQNVKKNYIIFMEKLSQGFYDQVDFRVKDPSSLGTTFQNDRPEEDDQSINTYLTNQTVDVHLNSNIDVTKEPYFGFDPDICTLFIKSVPRPVSRNDIMEVVAKLEGFKGLIISDPVKKMNLTRYCWIQFESQATCNQALLSLNGIIMKDEALAVNKSTSKAKRVKILKGYPKSRTETDLLTSVKLAQTLDKEIGIENNSLLDNNNHKQKSTLNNHFDMILLYLRRVHAFDFFTCTQFQSQRILSLKIGSAFLRNQADYKQLEGISTVFKKIQETVEKRIQKGIEVADHLAVLREEIEKFIRETEKLGANQTKDAWKCLYCDKKFKTSEFLSKHIITKHNEIKLKKIQLIMEQAYIKDPTKITLSSIRDERDNLKNRKPFSSGPRRDNRRREPYKDFDEPEAEKVQKITAKPMVNFLDI